LLLMLGVEGATPAAVPAASRRLAPSPAIVHVVTAGQTLSGIAHAYGVRPSTILQANRLPSGAPLRVGQRLVIPGGKRPPPTPAPAPLSVQDRAALERSLQEDTAPPPARPDAPGKPVRTDAVLAWPILGPLNSPFGPRWGRFHAGMDIGSPHYQEVAAAADGHVLYAGETAGPLGQAVVLQHGEGLQTVYAHLSIIIATEGQAVRQGQAIGGVGDTGRATGPHLHFEVRRNGTPVDPADHLPATLDELVGELTRSRP
jgi:murein DD-endopeptidase MepM/ murein hydrolase activator NlpD